MGRPNPDGEREHARRPPVARGSHLHDGGEGMRVSLESTTKIVRLMVEGREVPARIWEGQTESGIPCHAYITRIAVADGLHAAEVGGELVEHRRATPAAHAMPARCINSTHANAQ